MKHFLKNRTIHFLLFLPIAYFLPLNCNGQFSLHTPLAQASYNELPDKPNDTVTLNKHRLYGIMSGFTIAYSGSLVALHYAWYRHDARSSFYFHDDFHDWNQMDKAGHFWTAFHQSRLGIDALRWAGVPEKKAILYGGMTGIILQAPIEIFDGFSRGYGASVSDMLANIAGSAAIVAQELTWGKVKIMPKYSFNPSPYSKLRPNVLGASLPEQILKDYNAQNYWLSFDLSSFTRRDKKLFPWMNIALGYGASGMVYGNPKQNRIYGYDSNRRFFLSPDINLQNIKTRNKILKKTLYLMSAFRIPMPAIEINNKKGIVLHPILY
jgi:uncharacterized protein YfiM (DUF2279 family)